MQFYCSSSLDYLHFSKNSFILSRTIHFKGIPVFGVKLILTANKTFLVVVFYWVNETVIAASIATKKYDKSTNSDQKNFKIENKSRQSRTFNILSEFSPRNIRWRIFVLFTRRSCLCLQFIKLRIAESVPTFIQKNPKVIKITIKRRYCAAHAVLSKVCFNSTICTKKFWSWHWTKDF